MKLKEIVSFLDQSVPPALQEDYDNSGLQTGNTSHEINAALLTVDVTDDVVDEAASKRCGLIISHHPLIFKGVRSITNNDSTGRILLKAVKNDIAIYSAHTNLDSIAGGVSWRMAEKIGLREVRVLSPLRGHLLKLVTFVPESSLNEVREAVFKAGAGVIGRYDNCSFTSPGTGTFRGGEDTDPYAGERGVVNYVPEIRFETILYRHNRFRVEEALVSSHPYEEPAYDFYPVENTNSSSGTGCIGILQEPSDEIAFLKMVRKIFGTMGVRHSIPTGRLIRKVALCGGAGSFLLNDALRSDADAFLTADIKYHTFQEAAGNILLADIGHFESEKFTVEILYDLIIKKFPTFALRFSEINTNPINYLT